MVVDKAWNYLTVPDQNLDGIKTLTDDTAILAPWKFCSPDEDEGDIIGSVVESIGQGDCSGDKINSLAWDVINAKDIFESLPEDPDKVKGRFVMTNGGLTMFSPSRWVVVSLFFTPFGS